MTGIAALAFHFPTYSIRAEAYGDAWEASLAAGIREKTVADHDEDEVTLAVEAVRRLRIPDQVGFLATATLEGPALSPTVALALGMEEADKADFKGSTNAAGEALLSCLDFVRTHHDPAVLVAANAPHGQPEDPVEHPRGAGAVALLLASDGPLGIEAVASHALEGASSDGKGRQEGGARSELAKDTIAMAADEGLKEVGPGPVAVNEPDGLFPSLALKGLVESERIGGGVVELAGDMGSASPLLALAEIVAGARKGDRMGLVTYGAGSAVVLSLRRGPEFPKLKGPLATLSDDRSYLDYPTYARYRRFLAGRDPAAEVSQGAYVSLPAYLEFAAARYRLMASRCATCKRVDFPPRAVCLDCGHHEFVQEPLSGKGEVYARTIIAPGSSPTEFQAQQDLVGPYGVALVQLEEGPRIIAQLTEVDPHLVEIGMPVEAVLRRIFRQEGVVRYGYKFRPAARASVRTEIV